MNHWLLRRPPHYSEIQPSLVGQPWDYDKVFVDARLKAGDTLYLFAAYGELYGWGLVTKSVAYQDNELGKEALRITAVRPVVHQNLVPAEEIKRVPSLTRLFANSDLNLLKLKPHQVNSLNRLIRSKGKEAPADINEYKNPDLHLSRLIKIYEAAEGSRTKLIELMDILKDDVAGEEDAWDEADYMKDEGWVEVVGDNGPPLVRLTHKGIKSAEKYAPSSVETKEQLADKAETTNSNEVKADGSKIESLNSADQTIKDITNELGAILLGRYRIIRHLGHGGMGKVYEAIDLRLTCTVAIKEASVINDDLRDAFNREARLLANLHHPALPAVTDYFNENNRLYLVMQFIPGDDFREALKRQGGPFPQADVIRWADELLDVLDYLHSHSPPIIHRDIKPGNLKLSGRGRLILLDFGLSKGAAGQMSTVITTKSILGFTQAYASLEQIHGTGTDPRSDLYSLGATLYHLLTGEVPLDAPTRFDALDNGHPDPLRPAHEVNTNLSRALSALISRAMTIKRRDRHASASEMRSALTKINQEVGSLEAEPTLLMPTPEGDDGELHNNRVTIGTVDDNIYEGAALYSSPEIFRERITDLLEKQRLISINRYMQSAARSFYDLIRNIPADNPKYLGEVRDNQLLPLLESLTAMGVVFIEYDQWELLSALRRTFYSLCLQAEKTQFPKAQTAPPFLSKTWLWQEVITRVYSLGALLVYREQWEQTQALIQQEVSWEDEYYRHTFWSRYFSIMISRAGELKDDNFVSSTINYIEARPWLSTSFMSDKDEFTNAVSQFDFLQCVYVLAGPDEVSYAGPYPSFAIFHQRRIEPILLKLISDGKLRKTLTEVTDNKLASIIHELIQLSGKVPNHYSGWGYRWSDSRIQQFMKMAGGQ